MEAKLTSELVKILSSHIDDEELKELYVRYMTQTLAVKDADPLINFDDLTEELPYTDKVDLFKPSIHIGHRKLGLTEIRFLSRFADPSKEQIVLYTGASPWTQGGLLMRLFPNIKFILVDPVRVNAKDLKVRTVMIDTNRSPSYQSAKRELLKIKESDEKVFAFQVLFGNNFAQAIHDVFPEIYFMSDIRTVSGPSEFPDSLDILWNMAQQMNWMFIMKPALSMLKFRHPYYEDNSAFNRLHRREPYRSEFARAKANGIDFVTNQKNKKLIYLMGEIEIQPWAPKSSTESRLIVAHPFELFDYGHISDWENKYFYYTAVARAYGHYINPNANLEIGFCNCNDCAVENYIWTQYLSKYETGFTVHDLVLILGQYVNRDFQGIPLHAHCYELKSLLLMARANNQK